jgi:hypothetical protein
VRIAGAARMGYARGMGAPYREADESADREGAALAVLGMRRTRLRAWILTLFLIAGTALGLVGAWLVREAQLIMWDYYWPVLSGALGFGIPLFASGGAGVRVANRVVHARTEAWLDELSRHYHVKRERLVEVTEMINAAERS